MALFEPAPPMGPPDIPGLRALVVRFSFVEGITEHLNDTTLRPPAVLGLPRRNPLDRETPMNSIRAELLLDTPAIDHPDDLGFRLVDHEVLGRGRRLMHRGIPIRGIAPVAPALTGGKELPAPRPFAD
jgi:hypothetical protein